MVSPVAWMARMVNKKWVVRIFLALAAGALLVGLPDLLTRGVGPDADLSGKLGLGGGVGAVTFAVLFLAGVLTSLTPCVYPLIPITVSVFGARQVEHRTRSLALSMDAIESVTCLFMATALLGGLLAEYFLGFWWADYLATGVILGFVAREAVESYHELHEEESVAHA